MVASRRRFLLALLGFRVLGGLALGALVDCVGGFQRLLLVLGGKRPSWFDDSNCLFFRLVVEPGVIVFVLLELGYGVFALQIVVRRAVGEARVGRFERNAV